MLGPDEIPAKMLPVPATLNTRLPPMLYCVVALTMLLLKVPPAVPLPLMLKFEADCGDAVFWM